MTRDWAQTYRQFTELERKFRAIHPDPAIGMDVFRRSLSPNGIAGLVEEARTLGVDITDDLPAMELIREALAENADTHVTFTQVDRPAESVYHAAIFVKQLQLDDAVNNRGLRKWLFRGQRRHDWATLPTIFRDLTPDDEGSQKLEERIRALRSAVQRIRHVQLAEREIDCLAIAQHYSNVLDVGTWLLDLSFSPYVSLCFASHRGVSGDIGVLTYIEHTEWEKFSGGGTNRVGTIREVQLPEVARIRNQHALFVEAPHPELYRQLSHRCIFFRQQSDIVFEDSDEGVSVRDIYPEDDSIVSLLRSSISTEGASQVLEYEPSLDCLSPPTPDVYREVAFALLDRPTTQPTRILVACRIYEQTQARSGDLPLDILSLHQLRRCVKFLVDGEFLGWELFFESCYLQHAKTPQVVDTLASCVAGEAEEIRSAFERARAKMTRT